MSDILLDPQIRDNALIPILGVFLCSNLIRQNLLMLTKDEPKADVKQMRQNNVLGRARTLRAGGAKFLTDEAYRNRKGYYTKKDTGLLHKPPTPKGGGQMEQQDPAQAVGMMKSQMIFFVSQAAIGYWVNFLYTGFLVGKTPFPLTFRFKSMLQRGVDVDNLEPGYISGLCWYFIIMMSIGSIQAFLMSLVENSTIDPGGLDDPMMMMMMPQAAAMNPLMGGPDMKKMYTQEKEALDIHPFQSNMDAIETELWKKWKKKK